MTESDCAKGAALLEEIDSLQSKIARAKEIMATMGTDDCLPWPPTLFIGSHDQGKRVQLEKLAVRNFLQEQVQNWRSSIDVKRGLFKQL